jgi:hypothetical protein
MPELTQLIVVAFLFLNEHKPPESTYPDLCEWERGMSYVTVGILLGF